MIFTSWLKKLVNWRKRIENGVWLSISICLFVLIKDQIKIVTKPQNILLFIALSDLGPNYLFRRKISTILRGISESGSHLKVGVTEM